MAESKAMEDLKAWLDDNPDLLARWAFLKKETKKQGVGCFPSDKNDEVKREYITTFLEIAGTSCDPFASRRHSFSPNVFFGALLCLCCGSAEKKQGTADQSAPSSGKTPTPTHTTLQSSPSSLALRWAVDVQLAVLAVLCWLL